MIEALIAWAGALSALGIACRTLLALTRLYYTDKEKIRLAKLDQQIASRVAPVDEDSVLGKIVELANTKLYPYQLGEGVIDELKTNRLIDADRAHYLMVGADSHRGGR